jgi:hypothetical protein
MLTSFSRDSGGDSGRSGGELERGSTTPRALASLIGVI